MIIPVDRQKLIEILNTNRANHNAIFQEAVEGYRAKAIEKLNQYIDEVKEGKIVRSYWHMPEPEDHTEEYDRVIGLLEMATDKQVKMSDVEYQSYVLDNWSWKKAFIASNSYYSSTAKALQGESDEDDD